MKKLVIIFTLLLLAAGCDKTVVSQSDNSSPTSNTTSTIQVISNPTAIDGGTGTFYLKSKSAKIYKCASSSCGVIETFYNTQAAFTLNYKSVGDLPEWVPVNIDDSVNGKGLIDGFINKKDFTDQSPQPQKLTKTTTPVVAPALSQPLSQPTPTQQNQTAQPAQTQQPAIVCNNVSGGSLPAGWYSDGQGNCSPTSRQQQAAAVAAQQQAAQAAQQAQQQAAQQAAQAVAQAQTAMYQTQYQAVQTKIQPLKDQYNALQTTSSSQNCLSNYLGDAGIQCLLNASQAADVGEYENAILADFFTPVTTTSIAYENKLDNLFQQIFQIKMDYAQQIANISGSAGDMSRMTGEEQNATAAANAKITAINQQIQTVRLDYQYGITP